MVKYRLKQMNPDLIRQKLEARIEHEPNSGCWLWAGSINERGYGSISTPRGTRRVHRVAYELFTGRPIPPGLTLDHLCRVRSCVNPDHLEPVTNRENILRGIGLTAVNARMTFCKRGHLFGSGNFDWRRRRDGRTWRRCIPCERYRMARRPSRARIRLEREP